ncbi:response regulator [Myxococcota bacterium]|nr:response regulator [Myxococcota bacterium]
MTEDPTPRPARILLVDDDEDVAMLTREAFRRTGLPVHLEHVGSGAGALDLLRARTEQAVSTDLVLLDLHMPDMDGDEVLARINEDPSLDGIPVVVLTGAASPMELSRLAHLGCCACIPKSLTMRDYVADLRQVTERWAGAAARRGEPPRAG